MVLAIDHYDVDFIVASGRAGGNPLFRRGSARYRGDEVVAEARPELPATLVSGV